MDLLNFTFVCSHLPMSVQSTLSCPYLLQVLNECVEAEAWLREKRQQQDGLPKYASPALLSADVRKKAETLDRYLYCLSIFRFWKFGCVFILLIMWP